MGNIILNEDMHISTTKLTATDSNDLLQISFYVSKKYNENNVCIALTDNQGIFDIIPLTYEKDASNYKVYRVDCKNELRIKNGECKMIFFVFDCNFEVCKSSNSLNININFDNHNLFHQTYINRKLSADIANYYDKILKMTTMNIEIYNKITGGETANEN